MSLSRQEINKRYYQRHREKILAKANSPGEKAKKQEYDRKYYIIHSEEKKATSRRWREEHPEKVEEQNKIYRKRKIELNKTLKYRVSMSKSRKKYIVANPDKHQAHMLLNQAVRRGDIQRKPCNVCGNPIVEGHHEDYTKPLEVIWLCRKCHCNHHKERRQNVA